jgi:2-polyprenyl-6-methoxyphenol hydroxylase-like FAD-dependent oxidoreductase
VACGSPPWEPLRRLSAARLPKGFLEYLATTPPSPLHDLIRHATPVGEPAHYRFPSGIRRRYDLLESFPEGLLRLGDSICHYNFMYGQGMSAACRQAIGLGRALEAASELNGLWRTFFPEAYQETRAPVAVRRHGGLRDSRCTGDFPSEELPLLGALQRPDSPPKVTPRPDSSRAL